MLFTLFLAQDLKPMEEMAVNIPQAILPPNPGSFAASVLLLLRKSFLQSLKTSKQEQPDCKALWDTSCKQAERKKRKCLLEGMQNLFHLQQKKKGFTAERCCSISSVLLSTAKLLTLLRTCIALPTRALVDVNILLKLNENMSVGLFKIASHKVSVVKMIWRER